MGSVVVNCANLHQGGGIQVASSFLDELSNFEFDHLKLIFWVSSEVDMNLRSLGSKICTHPNYFVKNLYGIKAIYSDLNVEINCTDIVFSVFGPNYLRVKAKKEIVGFAQPWILNFNNPIANKMSLLDRNILRLKFFIQWLFFLRADNLVVELEHVKDSLVKYKGIDAGKVSVVYNTVSSLYFNQEKWRDVLVHKKKGHISLGIVTRDYPHKNLSVLPSVAKCLKDKYSLDVHFYVTLNDGEWAGKDSDFKQCVSTVGALTPDQCPSFYKQMDGVIFPSLLECFSATPLEAMVMEKPLFASDRDFVRDVCGDFAVYFDPLDPNDIARKIANYFTLKEDRSAMLKKAREYATNFSSAKGRAEKYLKIIQDTLEGI
ncbi:glycosyltransferase [Pseudomonas chengduensis]|nr:glycosyltransferase [Pseudomonas chengduensis]MDH1868548.1 glycosyltransferase [Pseudomonas chengduensis]